VKKAEELKKIVKDMLRKRISDWAVDCQPSMQVLNREMPFWTWVPEPEMIVL